MIRFSLALTCIVVLFVTFLFVPVAAANGPVFTVVYPTGVFPDDVNNVQAAKAVTKSLATNRLSKRYAFCNVNVWNDMAERGGFEPPLGCLVPKTV
jgi:hypothetical protein